MTEKDILQSYKELDMGFKAVELKHKYIKREGSPGDYTYVYTEAEGGTGATPKEDLSSSIKDMSKEDLEKAKTSLEKMKENPKFKETAEENLSKINEKLGEEKPKIESIEERSKKIVDKLDSASSGGRTELGRGGAIIIKERYKDEYKIYHDSSPRGGQIPVYVIKEKDIPKIIQINDKFLKKEEELKKDGWRAKGRDLYFQYDKEGKVVRDPKTNEILEKHLVWGE